MPKFKVDLHCKIGAKADTMNTVQVLTKCMVQGPGFNFTELYKRLTMSRRHAHRLLSHLQCHSVPLVNIPEIIVDLPFGFPINNIISLPQDQKLIKPLWQQQLSKSIVYF